MNQILILAYAMIEGLNSELIMGVVLAVILIAVMMLPTYCCQISNEEYNKIVNKMKEIKKEKYS